MSEHALKENGADAVKSVRNAATDALNRASEKFSTGYDAARSKVSDASHLVAERSRVAAEGVDSFVQENPWRAIGIAAGVGFALGLLLSRRD